MTPAERERIGKELLEMYRENPDAGLHGAAEWLLRQWGQEKQFRQIDRQLAGKKADADRQWYVTPQGHTMVMIRGPVEFLMGAPTGEVEQRGNEPQHRRRIAHSFAVASKIVSVEQYQVFLKANPPNPHIRAVLESALHKYAPTADCPMITMTWYEAAAYCNWLTKTEGIPEDQCCYLPNASGEYAAGMRPAPDFLDRTGYRLPTEGEWEYACRAGATTARYYGETPQLLAKYAWYQENSKERIWPVGSLKPNDFGMFDMQGNVLQHCHDAYANYRLPAGGALVEDSVDTSLLDDKVLRVLRGGSFINKPGLVRSADRNWVQPAFRSDFVGFRVARTCR